MAAVGHMAMNHRQVNKIILFAGSTALTAPVYVYEWLRDSGFGSRLADGGNTTTLNAYDALAANSAGNLLGVASSNSPYIHMFAISKDGIGTKFSNPGTLPTGNGRHITFTPNSNTIAIGHSTSPFVSAYPASTSGFGTKIANPTTLPASSGQGVSWTPNGAEVMIVGSAVPRLAVYNWTGGFGTRQANSYGEYSFTGYGGPWSSDGTKFVFTSGLNGYGPFVADHTPGNGISGFSAAATQIGGAGWGIRINYSEDAIVMGQSGTPYMAAYQWSKSTGLGTKYADPATLLTNYATTLCFTPSGTDVVGSVTMNPPGVAAYKWTNAAGFGTKYSNPASTTGANTRGAALQPFYQQESKCHFLQLATHNSATPLQNLLFTGNKKYLPTI